METFLLLYAVSEVLHPAGPTTDFGKKVGNGRSAASYGLPEDLCKPALGHLCPIAFGD
jgi:hypothetical protein